MRNDAQEARIAKLYRWNPMTICLAWFRVTFALHSTHTYTTARGEVHGAPVGYWISRFPTDFPCFYSGIYFNRTERKCIRKLNEFSSQFETNECALHCFLIKVFLSSRFVGRCVNWIWNEVQRKSYVNFTHVCAIVRYLAGNSIIRFSRTWFLRKCMSSYVQLIAYQNTLIWSL